MSGCSPTLPASWNDTPARQSIVSFVEGVCREGGDRYVPAAERIAVFGDGLRRGPGLIQEA